MGGGGQNELEKEKEMTIVEQSIHEQDHDKHSRHMARWVSMAIIIVIAAGLGIWFWQSGSGMTLANLPVADTTQERQPHTVDPSGEEATQRASSPGEQANISANLTNEEGANEAGGAKTGRMRVDGVRPAGQTRTGAVSDEAIAAVPAVDEAVPQNVKTGVIAGQIMAVAGINGAELRNSDDGALMTTAPIGAPLTASARSEDEQWLYVQTDEAEGWVEAAQVYVFGIDKLPVRESPPVMETDINEQPQAEESPAAPVLANVSANVEVVVDVVTPISVQTPEITAMVSLTDGRLNVRSGPDADSAIIAKAYPDEMFTAIARDEAGAWLQIALTELGGGFGWVSAQYLETSASIASLPISTALSEAPAYVEAASESASTSPSVAANPASSVANATGLNGTLVFQSTPGMIYAHDLDSGQTWPLTTGYDPAISPDGTTVAFTRGGGENGVYLIDIDGSNERLIFSGRSLLAAPKWSTDGQWILFNHGNEDECYRVSRNGCVSAEELASSYPDGAPANVSVIYDNEYNLAVVDINGDNYHDLATLESAQTADWNAAGVVYASSAGIQITTDASDAENQLVTFDYLNPNYFDPDWQPDGGQIAFTLQSGNHREIYVVNPDGSGLAALTKPVTTLVDQLPSNVAPAYSPDGQHIVYLSDRGEDNSAGAWQLWVMDADGSNAQPLAIDVEIEYTFGGEQAVDWGV